MLGGAVGHPGRGVPTEFYFGSFITMTCSFSGGCQLRYCCHRRAVGLRRPTTIYGKDRDDRKGRPYAFWGITP